MSYNFKENYLNELRSALQTNKLNNSEIVEIIADYNEMYEEAKSHGYNDEEIYTRLGNPRDIAKELNNNFFATINPYSKKHRKNWFISASPIIAFIAFILLGSLGGYWHPGWLVFMLVPISATLFGSKKSFLTKIVPLSPFLALITFIMLGYFGYWAYSWIAWLLIPLCAIISNNKHT